MKRRYTSFEQLPLYMSVEEMATLLGISRAGAYALTHREGCPAVYMGKRILLPRDRLIEWLDSQNKNEVG